MAFLGWNVRNEKSSNPTSGLLSISLFLNLFIYFSRILRGFVDTLKFENYYIRLLREGN